MTTHSNLYFAKVGKDSPLAPMVCSYFQQIISDCYGPQNQALEKIFAQKDRVCEMLIDSEKNEPVGIVVYKTSLVSGSFEIKTLFVTNPDKYSGRNIASLLLRHVAEKALLANAQNLLASVCSYKPESLAFFLKHGFQVYKTVKDCYIKGIDEFFLHHTNLKELFQINTLPTQNSSPIFPQLHVTICSEQEDRLFNYFQGADIASHLIEESLHLNMHTHTPNPCKKYLCLFLSPLLDSENLIGYVASAINAQGDRHILGCIPHQFPHNFWQTLFSTWKKASIEEFAIISYPKTISLPSTITTIYPKAKLVSGGKQRSWDKQRFSPTCFSIQFIDVVEKAIK